MRDRVLGKTGLHLSELTLGTWGLSGDAYGPVDPAVAERIVGRALELGVTTFDTADVYGDGAMERLLGARLRSESTTTYVVTKLGTERKSPRAQKRFDAAHLREAFERSSERLGRERVDVVLLHNPSAAALARGEAAETLRELATAGRIGAWGASVGDVATARAALAQGASVLELAYNVFFSADLHAIAGELAMAGTGVLARSVLSHGLLAGLWSESKTFEEGDHRKLRWTREELTGRLTQLDALRPLISGKVLTLRAASLRFVLANHLVSSAVLGPRTVPQLEQLVREAGNGPPYLPDAALGRLPRDLATVGISP